MKTKTLTPKEASSVEASYDNMRIFIKIWQRNNTINAVERELEERGISLEGVNLAQMTARFRRNGVPLKKYESVSGRVPYRKRLSKKRWKKLADVALRAEARFSRTLG